MGITFYILIFLGSFHLNIMHVKFLLMRNNARFAAKGNLPDASLSKLWLVPWALMLHLFIAWKLRQAHGNVGLYLVLAYLVLAVLIRMMLINYYSKQLANTVLNDQKLVDYIFPNNSCTVNTKIKQD